MTPHRSSISSSDTRRYLRTLVATLAALVIGLVSITAIGYRMGWVEAANHEIYRYQRAKIDAPAPIDVAFVGDSSLGNAIDARLFAELTGRPTANLALNGSYGAGGSYNMVRKLIAAKHPHLIVVMQSIDSMRRDNAFPGFYFSAEPSDLLAMPPMQILELYFSWKTAKRIVQQVAKSGFSPKVEVFDGDYISQAAYPIDKPVKQVLAENPLQPSMVAAAQMHYLHKIATTCAAARITCVFASGPIYQDYCTQTRGYLDALGSAVDATGLKRIAGTPLCVDDAEIGNSIDHVRPDLKQEYTRRYYALLRDVVASLGT